MVSLSSAGVKTHLGPSDVWRRLCAALPVCSDFPPAGQTPASATRPLKAHYGSITCPGPQQQQLPPPSPHLHPSLSGSLFLYHDRAGSGQPRDSFAHAGHFHPKQVSHGSDPGSAVALETCNIWENRREWGGLLALPRLACDLSLSFVSTCTHQDLIDQISSCRFLLLCLA